MIKYWSLKNFKSFRRATRIDLSQINVFAGANSSGKSSIIQSILLLKQTLQYGSYNRSLALNGPLLRLGAFEDVRNSDALGEDLSVEFQFVFGDRELANSAGAPWARSLLGRSLSSSEGGALREITLSLSYVSQNGGQKIADMFAESPTLTPTLANVNLDVIRAANHDTVRGTSVDLKLRRNENTSTTASSYNSPDYEVSLNSETLEEMYSEKFSPKILGGMASFFFPQWIAISSDATAERAYAITDGIFSPYFSLISSYKLDHEMIPQRVIVAMNQWLVSRGAEQIIVEKEAMSFSEIRKHLRPFLEQTRAPFGHLVFGTRPHDDKTEVDIAQSKLQILELLLGEDPHEYKTEFKHPRDAGAACAFIEEYFKEGIRYIGPLRDNPKPVYQPEALESTTDVGYRGEHTAAIFNLNGSRVVTYHTPPDEALEEDYIQSSKRVRGTLRDAVTAWLAYLGVADDVVTTDVGVYGHRLRVATDQIARLHDLTNVGVGVSQVLPIVVMALLAPPGSFLIFEQPELHLNPKVQARLGDLFIALALDGKQLLLETHSEYLVDRFRLRIALSDTDSFRHLINMFFSQKALFAVRMGFIRWRRPGSVPA